MNEIVIAAPEKRGDRIRLAGELRLEGVKPATLWYEVPAEFEAALTERADPFVIASVFPMLVSGKPARIRATVSPTLLANLEEFMHVWSAWRPERYHFAELTADAEEEAPQQGQARPAILSFSGGVDSCYSAWRHRRGPMGRRRRDMQAGLFVHGFDLELSEAEAFHHALGHNRAMLDSLGMQLIPLATNFRELAVDWEDAHGSAIASCLALFQRRFGTGLIAATLPYAHYGMKWGSTPWTDRLLSSAAFEVVHDGAETYRLEKVRALLAWPEALQGLRVCWEGFENGGNCCVCEKCIRTILAFRIVGGLLPGCFPHDVTDEQIRELPLSTFEKRFPFTVVLDAARAAGLGDTTWARAMQRAVARWKPGPLSSVRRAWLRIYPPAAPPKRQWARPE